MREVLEMMELPFDRPDPLRPPPAYAGLEPVTEVLAPEGRAWLVTSYEAVVSVLTDARFGMTPGGEANDTLFQDGAAHARLRRLVARAFTPRAIEGLRARVEGIADERVAAFADAGPPGDLVAGLAGPVSTRVIGDLLGVRIEDARFGELVDVLSGDDLEAAALAWGDLQGFVTELVEGKRRALGDDLLSALIGVHDARDGRLSDGELVGVASTIVAAGHQTARNAIAAGALLLMAEGRLAGPVPDGVVEEVLRRLAGVIAEPFPRWARERVEVGGAVIEPGDLVLVRLEAANHDRRRFAEPERFVPGREPVHVSFGRGPHHCLGASLARIEVAAVLRALARRLPGLRVEGEVRWVRGYADAGPAAVSVVW